MKNVFLKLKRNIIPIIFILFLVFLLIFSKTNLLASKNGLILWATCLVPSLFPFFIATELLNQTKVPKIIGTICGKFMKPLFNVPGEGGYAFIMGIICGYPIGAKIVSNFYVNKLCTKEQAARMIAFTNNSGPLFIIGTVGISLFGNFEIGVILLLTHLLASITVGIIIGFISRIVESSQRFSVRSRSSIETINTTYNPICNFNNLGELLSTSINCAISTIFMIGGFVVLFSVIISIFNNLEIFDLISALFGKFGISELYSKALFTGLIELTNGVSLASSIVTKAISKNIILCAFLLGFGGISIFLQVFTIASKSKISVKYYIIGKLLQGVFAALYTYIIISNFLFINLDL